MKFFITVLGFLILGRTTEAIFPPGIWFPLPIPSPPAGGVVLPVVTTCPATGCCIKGYCMAAVGTPASACTVTGTTAACGVTTELMPACFNSAGTGCSAAATACMAMTGCATACPPAAANVVLCAS